MADVRQRIMRDTGVVVCLLLHLHGDVTLEDVSFSCPAGRVNRPLN